MINFHSSKTKYGIEKTWSIHENKSQEKRGKGKQMMVNRKQK